MESEYRLSEEHTTDRLQRDQGASALDPVLPLYKAPSVWTYTDQEILDQLGPAQTAVSF